jgi:DNA-binding transcriptional LysR family regulator
LPAFQAQYPDISVSLSLRTLPFQFNDQPFDGAIYHSQAIWPGTQGTHLFAEKELVPVCAPSLALTAGDDALAGLPHFHLASRPDAWRDWYQQGNDTYPPEVAGGPRYEVFSMVIAAAQAGLGVGLAPRFLVQEALDGGELIQPVDRPLPVPQGYFFGYPERAETSVALMAFERWLKTVAKT